MRDPRFNQAATATTLSSLLIENTAIWLINSPIVIPTETCIILNPNENEPKYADSAVVLEEYGERSPPSRPSADCKPSSASVGTADEKRVGRGVGDVRQSRTEPNGYRESVAEKVKDEMERKKEKKCSTHGNQEHQTRYGTRVRPAP